MIRKIGVVTGSRAEYNLLKPILFQINKNPKLELKLIVTGMHLVPEFGHTVDEIKKDGFTIDEKVNIKNNDDTLNEMAFAVGKGIIEFTKLFKELNPDMIFLLGDRIEVLASAISASIMQIPIAHMGGGQNSGSIDNNIRHAVTTLSHIHFTTNEIRAERLRRMGEDPNRIHVVGDVFSENLEKASDIRLEDIGKKFSIDINKPIFLVTFHPDTSHIEQSIQIMENILNTIEKLQEQTVIIYPNCDAGGKRLIEMIEEIKEKHSFIKTYKNLTQIDFFCLMKISSVMIGNSSSGFNEAYYFNLPVINIGERQKYRDRKPNITNIKGSENEIEKLVEDITSKKEEFVGEKDLESFLSKNRNTAKKIVKILEDIELSDKLIHKIYAEEL